VPNPVHLKRGGEGAEGVDMGIWLEQAETCLNRPIVNNRIASYLMHDEPSSPFRPLPNSKARGGSQRQQKHQGCTSREAGGDEQGNTSSVLPVVHD
jgi:hypothetical protein